MDAVYNHRVLGFAKSARDGYRAIGSDKWNPGKKADACTSCGVCLDKCTQGIDIPAEMNFARETFR
jgi:predicted aldo/keto reductase-like oxidoreductase